MRFSVFEKLKYKPYDLLYLNLVGFIFDFVDIPTETFNRLLDLLCVNNGKDPDKLSSAEENFLYRGVDKEPRQLWM